MYICKGELFLSIRTAKVMGGKSVLVLTDKNDVRKTVQNAMLEEGVHKAVSSSNVLACMNIHMEVSRLFLYIELTPSSPSIVACHLFGT